MGGKWLGVLKEVAPFLARVAVIFNPETGPFSPLFLRAVETAAPSFAVKPIATPVHDAADIERAISAFAHDLNGGLIVLPSAFVAVHRHERTTPRATFRRDQLSLQSNEIFGRTNPIPERSRRRANCAQAFVAGPAVFPLYFQRAVSSE